MVMTPTRFLTAGRWVVHDEAEVEENLGGDKLREGENAAANNVDDDVLVVEINGIEENITARRTIIAAIITR